MRAPPPCRSLGRAGPALVFLPEEDEYLPAPESQALIMAAEGAGHPVIVRPGDHTTVVLRAWGFTLDPTELSGRATPELQAEELHLLRGARGRAPRGR